MITILKKMYEVIPEKSTIVLKEKCSDCGCKIMIEVTPTSVGFGLHGGAFIKCPPYDYLAKCHTCYQANLKIEDNVA